METLILKQNISKKPKPYYYRKFPKKLDKRKDSIIQLKLHYKKKFDILKLPFILPLEYDIDSKWNPLARVLEQYLDILITPHEYIETSTQKVKRSLCIVGSRAQIIIAANLFNEIYHLFYGAVERKTRRVRLLHRQARRRNRRYRTNQKIPDARVKISLFKGRLLGFLESEISKRSEALNTDRKIKIKGYMRRKRIKNYIWVKYKKKWRTRL